jgi:DNA-binding MarR family transcriptional regulator
MVESIGNDVSRGHPFGQNVCLGRDAGCSGFLAIINAEACFAVKPELIEQRITDLLQFEDWGSLRSQARYLAHDLGAELPAHRVRVIRQFQQQAHERLNQLEGAIGWEDSGSQVRPAFLVGLLYGTYHLCDGYASELAPVLEERAAKFKKTQRAILLVLAEAGALHPTALAQRTEIDPSSVSRALRVLREENYVRFVAADGAVADKRQRLYTLTPKGHDGVGLLEQEEPDPVPIIPVEPSQPSSPKLRNQKVANAPAPARFRETAVALQPLCPAQTVQVLVSAPVGTVFREAAFVFQPSRADKTFQAVAGAPPGTVFPEALAGPQPSCADQMVQAVVGAPIGAVLREAASAPQPSFADQTVEGVVGPPIQRSRAVGIISAAPVAARPRADDATGLRRSIRKAKEIKRKLALIH